MLMHGLKEKSILARRKSIYLYSCWRYVFFPLNLGIHLTNSLKNGCLGKQHLQKGEVMFLCPFHLYYWVRRSGMLLTSCLSLSFSLFLSPPKLLYGCFIASFPCWSSKNPFWMLWTLSLCSKSGCKSRDPQYKAKYSNSLCNTCLWSVVRKSSTQEEKNGSWVSLISRWNMCKTVSHSPVFIRELLEFVWCGGFTALHFWQRRSFCT